jgi:hypothetical protein
MPQKPQSPRGSWVIHQTPIGARLKLALDSECLRMANEWFFKWHFIKEGPVEIESFNGKPIRLGGIKFSGSAHTVYWNTIQRYLRKKISAIFEQIEIDFQKYPIEIHEAILAEAQVFVSGFAAKIRNMAIEKDRVLRGDGFNFPPPHDFGKWEGGQSADVAARVQSLREIYCIPKLTIDGTEMSLTALAKDKVSLVKKDGSIFRSDIPATVSSGMIITFLANLPIEVGDHFLRQLPSGLVDDFVVIDPGFMRGVGGAIGPHFQTKVRRSDEPVASPQTVINHIVGNNARVNINSTDNSLNSIVENSPEIFDKLASALAKNVYDKGERDALLNSIKELRAAVQTSTFTEKYQEFIASAANHMTIIAPFIPALTALLG